MPFRNVLQRFRKSASAHNRSCSEKQEDLRAKWYLLGLPIKILVLISENLPRETQVLLSQTCRPFRLLLVHRCGRSVDLDRAQRFEFLVCDNCALLHPVVSNDSHLAPWRASCSDTWRRLEDLRTGPYPITFGYRHVQLALKYNRLGCQSAYVAEILRPQIFQVNGLKWLRGWCQPKIVNGRFLVRVSRSGCLYQPTDDEDSEIVRICSHHAFVRPSKDEDAREKKRLSLGEKLGLPDRLSFRKCQSQAVSTPGVEVSGSCALCPVDWTVLRSKTRLYINSWHDLGSEGSPLDPTWRVQVAEAVVAEEEVGVGHEPGSVRHMYGKIPPLEARDKAIDEVESRHEYENHEKGLRAM